MSSNLFTSAEVRIYEDFGGDGGGVNEKFMDNAIRSAEIDWLIPKLGAALYADLLLNYTTAANKALKAQLARAMAHAAWYKLSTRYGVATTGKGFTRVVGDNELAVDAKQLAMAGESAYKSAEREWVLVAIWLKERPLIYPLYVGDGCNPARSNSFGISGNIRR